jgi:hypothetical protein
MIHMILCGQAQLKYVFLLIRETLINLRKFKQKILRGDLRRGRGFLNCDGRLH